MEEYKLEKNGTGLVYCGGECGIGSVKTITDGGDGESSPCNPNLLHADLIQIIWDVIESGAVNILPMYGFNDHNWTIEELKAAYKIKTGNDFVD
jgi:hypothetical protein